ncbi:MAG: hypothetical protein DCC55_39635 [Chloroflexi bacterium]|nr:MAG: hypothetical protein DCC55_39635 [Chloroflexota bacterium]
MAGRLPLPAATARRRPHRLGAAIDQSGDKHRHGGITKSGRKDLRHMLVEAARIAVRQPGHWQRLYQRLARRIGDHKAITAVARKLLVAVWHLLTHGDDGAPTAALLSPQQLAAKFLRLAGSPRSSARACACMTSLLMPLPCSGWPARSLLSFKARPASPSARPTSCANASPTRLMTPASPPPVASLDPRTTQDRAPAH